MGQAVRKPEEGAARLLVSTQAAVLRLRQGPQPNTIGVRALRPAVSVGKPTDAMFGTALSPPVAGTMVWDSQHRKPWWSDGLGNWYDATGNP